jgi:4-hydroxy-tetrahydrodipicolinate synthase
MDRSELKKQIVGPIATVPTPFDDNFGVDYGKMRAAAEWWVEQGLVTGRAVVKVAAAMGEGPQLRDSEWPELLKTVVDATGGKASVVCGIHYKDTVRTIEDARRAQDLGAIGLQISPPIFNDPKQDDILRYYGAVSDAIGIGILVYNTPWQTYGSIEVATFEKMVDFEHVVAIKWHPSEPEGYEEIFKLAEVFNIIDNNSTPVQCHKLGGKGFINLTAEVYPPFDMRIWDLMERGDYETAQAEWTPVNTALYEFYGKLDARSGGQARTKKALMAAMGRDFGPSRPPSLPVSAEEMEELRGVLFGFGWPVPEPVA